MADDVSKKGSFKLFKAENDVKDPPTAEDQSESISIDSVKETAETKGFFGRVNSFVQSFPTNLSDVIEIVPESDLDEISYMIDEDFSFSSDQEESKAEPGFVFDSITTDEQRDMDFLQRLKRGALDLGKLVAPKYVPAKQNKEISNKKRDFSDQFMQDVEDVLGASDLFKTDNMNLDNDDLMKSAERHDELLDRYKNLMGLNFKAEYKSERKQVNVDEKTMESLSESIGEAFEESDLEIDIDEIAKDDKHLERIKKMMELDFKDLTKNFTPRQKKKLVIKMYQKQDSVEDHEKIKKMLNQELLMMQNDLEVAGQAFESTESMQYDSLKKQKIQKLNAYLNVDFKKKMKGLTKKQIKHIQTKMRNKTHLLEDVTALEEALDVELELLKDLSDDIEYNVDDSHVVKRMSQYLGKFMKSPVGTQKKPDENGKQAHQLLHETIKKKGLSIKLDKFGKLEAIKRAQESLHKNLPNYRLNKTDAELKYDPDFGKEEVEKDLRSPITLDVIEAASVQSSSECTGEYKYPIPKALKNADPRTIKMIKDTIISKAMTRKFDDNQIKNIMNEATEHLGMKDMTQSKVLSAADYFHDAWKSKAGITNFESSYESCTEVKVPKILQKMKMKDIREKQLIATKYLLEKTFGDDELDDMRKELGQLFLTALPNKSLQNVMTLVNQDTRFHHVEDSHDFLDLVANLNLEHQEVIMKYFTQSSEPEKLTEEYLEDLRQFIFADNLDDSKIKEMIQEISTPLHSNDIPKTIQNLKPEEILDLEQEVKSKLKTNLNNALVKMDELNIDDLNEVISHVAREELMKKMTKQKESAVSNLSSDQASELKNIIKQSIPKKLTHDQAQNIMKELIMKELLDDLAVYILGTEDFGEAPEYDEIAIESNKTHYSAEMKEYLQEMLKSDLTDSKRNEILENKEIKKMLEELIHNIEIDIFDDFGDIPDHDEVEVRYPNLKSIPTKVKDTLKMLVVDEIIQTKPSEETIKILMNEASKKKIKFTKAQMESILKHSLANQLQTEIKIPKCLKSLEPKQRSQVQQFVKDMIRDNKLDDNEIAEYAAKMKTSKKEVGQIVDFLCKDKEQTKPINSLKSTQRQELKEFIKNKVNSNKLTDTERKELASKIGLKKGMPEFAEWVSTNIGAPLHKGHEFFDSLNACDIENLKNIVFKTGFDKPFTREAKNEMKKKTNLNDKQLQETIHFLELDIDSKIRPDFPESLEKLKSADAEEAKEILALIKKRTQMIDGKNEDDSLQPTIMKVISDTGLDRHEVEEIIDYVQKRDNWYEKPLVIRSLPEDKSKTIQDLVFQKAQDGKLTEDDVQSIIDSLKLSRDYTSCDLFAIGNYVHKKEDLFKPDVLKAMDSKKSQKTQNLILAKIENDNLNEKEIQNLKSRTGLSRLNIIEIGDFVSRKEKKLVPRVLLKLKPEESERKQNLILQNVVDGKLDPQSIEAVSNRTNLKPKDILEVQKYVMKKEQRMMPTIFEDVSDDAKHEAERICMKKLDDDNIDINTIIEKIQLNDPEDVTDIIKNLKRKQNKLKPEVMKNMDADNAENLQTMILQRMSDGILTDAQIEDVIKNSAQSTEQSTGMISNLFGAITGSNQNLTNPEVKEIVRYVNRIEEKRIPSCLRKFPKSGSEKVKHIVAQTALSKPVDEKIADSEIKEISQKLKMPESDIADIAEYLTEKEARKLPKCLQTLEKNTAETVQNRILNDLNETPDMISPQLIKHLKEKTNLPKDKIKEIVNCISSKEDKLTPKRFMNYDSEKQKMVENMILVKNNQANLNEEDVKNISRRTKIREEDVKEISKFLKRKEMRLMPNALKSMDDEDLQQVEALIMNSLEKNETLTNRQIGNIKKELNASDEVVESVIDYVKKKKKRITPKILQQLSPEKKDIVENLVLCKDENGDLTQSEIRDVAKRSGLERNEILDITKYIAGKEKRLKPKILNQLDEREERALQSLILNKLDENDTEDLVEMIQERNIKKGDAEGLVQYFAVKKDRATPRPLKELPENERRKVENLILSKSKDLKLNAQDANLISKRTKLLKPEVLDISHYVAKKENRKEPEILQKLDKDESTSVQDLIFTKIDSEKVSQKNMQEIAKKTKLSPSDVLILSDYVIKKDQRMKPEILKRMEDQSEAKKIQNLIQRKDADGNLSQKQLHDVMNRTGLSKDEVLDIAEYVGKNEQKFKPKLLKMMNRKENTEVENTVFNNLDASLPKEEIVNKLLPQIKNLLRNHSSDDEKSQLEHLSKADAENILEYFSDKNDRIRSEIEKTMEKSELEKIEKLILMQSDDANLSQDQMQDLINKTQLTENEIQDIAENAAKKEARNIPESIKKLNGEKKRVIQNLITHAASDDKLTSEQIETIAQQTGLSRDEVAEIEDYTRKKKEQMKPDILKNMKREESKKLQATILEFSDGKKLTAEQAEKLAKQTGLSENEVTDIANFVKRLNDQDMPKIVKNLKVNELQKFQKEILIKSFGDNPTESQIEELVMITGLKKGDVLELASYTNEKERKKQPTAMKNMSPDQVKKLEDMITCKTLWQSDHLDEEEVAEIMHRTGLKKSHVIESIDYVKKKQMRLKPDVLGKMDEANAQKLENLVSTEVPHGKPNLEQIVTLMTKTGLKDAEIKEVANFLANTEKRLVPLRLAKMDTEEVKALKDLVFQDLDSTTEDILKNIKLNDPEDILAVVDFVKMEDRRMKPAILKDLPPAKTVKLEQVVLNNLRNDTLHDDRAQSIMRRHSESLNIPKIEDCFEVANYVANREQRYIPHEIDESKVKIAEREISKQELNDEIILTNEQIQDVAQKAKLNEKEVEKVLKYIAKKEERSIPSEMKQLPTSQRNKLKKGILRNLNKTDGLLMKSEMQSLALENGLNESDVQDIADYLQKKEERLIPESVKNVEKMKLEAVEHFLAKALENGEIPAKEIRKIAEKMNISTELVRDVEEMFMKKESNILPEILANLPHEERKNMENLILRKMDRATGQLTQNQINDILDAKGLHDPKMIEDIAEYIVEKDKILKPLCLKKFTDPKSKIIESIIKKEKEKKHNDILKAIKQQTGILLEEDEVQEIINFVNSKDERLKPDSLNNLESEEIKSLKKMILEKMENGKIEEGMKHAIRKKYALQEAELLEAIDYFFAESKHDSEDALVSYSSITEYSGSDITDFEQGTAPLERYASRALNLLLHQGVIIEHAKDGDGHSKEQLKAQAHLARPGPYRSNAQDHLIQMAENGDVDSLAELAMIKLIIAEKASVPTAVGLMRGLAKEALIGRRAEQDKLIMRGCDFNPEALSQLATACVTLAAKAHLIEEANQGNPDAIVDLQEVLKMEQERRLHQVLLNNAEKGDKNVRLSAFAELRKKKEERDQQQQHLKQAAAKGDVEAIALLAAKKKITYDTLVRKAKMGDENSIHQLSENKHKEHARLIHLAHAGDQDALDTIKAQNKNLPNLEKMAKMGDVLAILEIDAMQEQLKLLKRAQDGCSHSLQKLKTQHNKEHERLTELAANGNLLAIQTLMKHAQHAAPDLLTMDDQEMQELTARAKLGDVDAQKDLKDHAEKLACVAQGLFPPGMKRGKRKKDSFESLLEGKKSTKQKHRRLKRDKWGRLLDKDGKPKSNKPWKITITTGEAADYHGKILSNGPLTIVAIIVSFMTLIMVLIQDKRT